jgi:hypothetical protein
MVHALRPIVQFLHRRIGSGLQACLRCIRRSWVVCIMSSRREDELERDRLRELSTLLRRATCDALARASVMATALDESRGEIDRLLMLDVIDANERRRVVQRAQIMLDAWRGMAGGSSVAGAR